jgi:hypothetical protein
MSAWGIMSCWTKNNHDVSEIQEENSFKGFWRMSFDGACSSSGVVLELYLNI